MAVRAFTQERLGPNARRITWEGLTDDSSDTGTPYVGHDDAIRTVQVKGTFGTGGNINIEGSLDGGTTFGLAHDTVGSDLSLGDSRVEQIQEGPMTFRPNCTAGDGTTDLDVIIIETLRARR